MSDQSESRERELHAISGLLDAAYETKPEAVDDWTWAYYLGEAAIRSLLAIEATLRDASE